MLQTDFTIHTVTTKSQLEKILCFLKDSNNNVLMKNSTSYLKIGNREVKTHFNSILYSEDKKALVLLTSNGEISNDLFEGYLSINNIPFHSVDFLKKEETNEMEKEIWFAKGKKEVSKALEDSKEKGYDTCTFYPKMKGKLELSYELETEEKELFDKRNIEGVIELDDKLIVLLQSKERSKMLYQQLFQMLWNDNKNVAINWDDQLHYFDKPKQYKKEQ